MLTQCILILSKVLNAFKTNKLCDDLILLCSIILGFLSLIESFLSQPKTSLEVKENFNK